MVWQERSVPLGWLERLSSAVVSKREQQQKNGRVGSVGTSILLPTEPQSGQRSF